jgi:hypothetical protein
MVTTHTIEEVIAIDRVTIDTNPAEFFLPVYTKKINLQKGMEHLITDIDCFIDSNGAFFGSGTSVGVQTLMTQILVTPYPAWAYNARPPSQFYWPTMPAGNNNVFYKRCITEQWDQDQLEYRKLYDESYPSITLRDEDLRTFYTDHLYVSVFFGVYNVTDELEVDNFTCSIMINMEEREADPVSHAIGTIREYNDAQQIPNEMQALLLDAQAGYSGYWFPPWHYGGMRPEIMVQSEQVARWLGSVEYSEDMVTRGGMQVARILASQMQRFDDAFGTPVGLGPEFPDWLRFLDSSPGVVGALRDEFPPMLKNTDGTTRML